MNQTPHILITRTRSGLATNSSSSHSMVVLPLGVVVPDEIPSSPDDFAWRHVYDDTWVAASELEKRHVLAAMLVTQSCELWGRGVYFGDVMTRAIRAFWDANPEADLDEDVLRNAYIAEIQETSRDAFDITPLNSEYGPAQQGVALPAWLEQDILTLCGLNADTDLSRHWADSDLIGGVTGVPRSATGPGPDRTAWAALCAVALDPRTVLLSPPHNQHHPLQDTYEDTSLGYAARQR